MNRKKIESEYKKKIKILINYNKNYYDTSKPLVTDKIKVIQGELEQSNVNTIEEMTKMITTIRAFEAYQKVIQTLDEADDQAVNSIGRVV